MKALLMIAAAIAISIRIALTIIALGRRNLE